MKKAFGTNFYSVYKDKAKLYDIFSSAEIFSSHLTTRLKQLFKGKILLDIACGSCHKTNLFSKYFETVYALDISSSLLEFARGKYKKNKKIHFILSSAATIPLLNNSIDTIFVSWGAFPLAKTIKEMKRVVKPGGVILRIGASGMDEFTTLFPNFDLKKIKRIQRQFEMAGFIKEEHIVQIKFDNLGIAKDVLSKILRISKKKITSNTLKHKVVLYYYKKKKNI